MSSGASFILTLWFTLKIVHIVSLRICDFYWCVLQVNQYISTFKNQPIKKPRHIEYLVDEFWVQFFHNWYQSGPIFHTPRQNGIVQIMTAYKTLSSESISPSIVRERELLTILEKIPHI